MILFSREIVSANPGSEKSPVVILHGLLGSSRNWLSTGKELQDGRAVYALDLRNHGQSFHADSMAYGEMAQDVKDWLDENGLRRVLLVGHSMGGKVAMRFATSFPDRVEKLVVVDISPKRNNPYHLHEVQALMGLGIEDATSRKAIEDSLAEQVSDWAMRQFLLTNLASDPEGGYRWQINLRVIHRWLPQLADTPLKTGERCHCPTLFVRGAKSGFMRDEDVALIEALFPKVQIKTLDSGHNPHMEKRRELIEAILKD